MNQAKPKIRLYVPESFQAGQTIALGQAQSHYLAHVMRGRQGDGIAIFNGQDGEWMAEIADISKKSVSLAIIKKLREQKNSPDLWLAFAPIKNKTELVVEKAVELGVSALLPVFTRHAVVRSINHEKLAAHAAEAAEQCGRLDVPRIEEHKDLAALLGQWPEDRTLLYGDETGGGAALKALLNSLPRWPAQCSIDPSPIRGEVRRGAQSGNLSQVSPPPGLPPTGGGEKEKYAILIGPEGGFSAEEHYMLKSAAFVTPFGMGPRILRADTAAVAALACMQAWLGDWEETPRHPALVAGSGATKEGDPAIHAG